MIAIDTNVLLRALIDDADAPEQCAAARRLLVRAARARVAAIVFIESIWVLHKSYKAPRSEVIRVATELLDHPRYFVEDTELLRIAVAVFSESNIDFSDAIALADSRAAKASLHTFDKKLARMDGAVLCE